MQKKIVAAICAAALALAMPVAAFAAGASDWTNFIPDGTQKSMAVAKIGEVKGDYVTLKNVEAVGVTGYVNDINAKAVGTTVAVPSNAVANSVQSFAFQADGNKHSNLKSFGTQYSKLSGDIVFDEDVTANLNSSVDTNNLYVVKVYNNQKGEEIYRTADKLTVYANGASPAAADPASFSFTGAGSGTLTVWMQNGQYGINPTQVIDDLNKSAENGNTSPKTGELL